MTIKIEIKLIDTDNKKELSYSQSKANYSRRKSLEKLEEYEKEILK